MVKIACFVSLGGLVYVYALYPLMLQVLVWIRGRRPVRRADTTPRVSLVISAYNEAAVIERKIRNTLSLDYPRGLLEVVIVSDASSDGTDEIARRFERAGVRLLRQPERRGKTAGLNAVLPTLAGEIVVFSDANAMYERDALRKLVRNFADAEVGCVTGEARYLKGGASAAEAGERAYWNYEIWIKRLETAIGSTVGGDGAIYGIRRSLWQPLPENAINDFLNPLQIVAAGWRAVYEPHAVCHEETAGGIGREWRRRVRIVSRSWRAVFQARGVLNPFRVGMFAFCLWSHKVLRWFSGAFLFVLLAAALSFINVVAGIAVAALVVALPWTRRMAAFVVYFAAIHAASFAGIVRGTIGNVSGVWATPREATAGQAVIRPGAPILLLVIACIAAAGLALLFGESGGARAVFWSALAVVAYVFAGYPLVLHAWAALSPKAVEAAAAAPRVCLLIAANDEAAVIGRKLENCLALDYPTDRLDIVVASDGSRDGTNEIVRTFAPRVRLLAFERRRGKTAAINDAMPSIAADVVVFSDANTFLRRDAVRVLVRNFADPAVGAVSGDVVLTGERAALAGSEDLYYRYERHLQRLESRIGSLVGVDGALYAVRRELFVAPPADTILDDMAIPMAVLRSGSRVVFEPSALAEEAGSDSSTQEFWRKVRLVAGAVQFLMRPDSGVPARQVQALFTLASHKTLRWMSPAFGAAALVASVVLAPASGFFRGIVAIEAGMLALAAAGCVPVIRRIPLVALAHYFCLVQVAAALGLLRGLAGRQPVTWRRFARATVQPS